MKLIFAILLLLSPLSTFAGCDEEKARNAISEERSLRGLSREWVLEASHFNDKYYYERTPLSEVFEAPEDLACSIKRSVVMDISVSASMNMIDECEERVTKWRSDIQSFSKDAQKMASVWEEVYGQCSKVRDKDLKSTVTLYYKQREDYNWTIDHFLNKRVAPLEKKCQEEKKFLQEALAAKDKLDCGKS